MFVGIGVAHGQGLGIVIVPIAMIGFGYFLMQKLVFDLVDEVWDEGAALVVKNRGQEQRIALSEIKNVNYSPFINPPRVTLSLRRPTVFGEQITFCAPVRLVPFSSSPVIADLIERIDRAMASVEARVVHQYVARMERSVMRAGTARPYFWRDFLSMRTAASCGPESVSTTSRTSRSGGRSCANGATSEHGINSRAGGFTDCQPVSSRHCSGFRFCTMV